MTYTYAILELSEAAYTEIKEKLEKVNYQDQFIENKKHGLIINMHGIAVAKEKS
jgi:hypothetical protein